MSSILSRENLDLIALKLQQAGIAERVTGLEQLQYFELNDGFRHACVVMTAHASKDLPNPRKHKNKSLGWRAGSKEQILETGIRHQTGNLTPSFCDWFDKHCSFDAAAETRNFLLPHMRPAEFAELQGGGSLSRQNNLTKSSPLQLQTKFANAVIEAMNLPAELSASEVYPDFARKAVELADEQQWPQDLIVEIEKGAGILLVSCATTGSASRVTKKSRNTTFYRPIVIKPHVLSDALNSKSRAIIIPRTVFRLLAREPRRDSISHLKNCFIWLCSPESRSIPP